MHPHSQSSPDPFAKVRGLGGALIGLLVARAAMRLVTYVAFRVAMPAVQVSEDPFTALRLLNGTLLGVENLLALVTMIVFLVWIHRVFKAVRATGGSTAYSPGMAVGGWFIPIANAVLPWLTVRDALRAVGRPTALAGLWWLVWLANTSLTGAHQLARQMTIVPELAEAIPYEVIDQIQATVASTFWPYFVVDTGAWALLAIIVANVRAAVAQPRSS